MKPEEQRIAIAEVCGWVRGWHSTLQRDVWRKGGLWATAISLPDYLSDLNAMHDAEKVLTENQRYQHGNLIMDILEKRKMDSMDWGFAGADLRAEAFLRTLNLWTTPPQ